MSRLLDCSYVADGKVVEQWSEVENCIECGNLCDIEEIKSGCCPRCLELEEWVECEKCCGTGESQEYDDGETYESRYWVCENCNGAGGKMEKKFG